jgi:hypothetical protein
LTDRSQRSEDRSLAPTPVVGGAEVRNLKKGLRTGKEIRFRFRLSEDKVGKEAKRRPTGW